MTKEQQEQHRQLSRERHHRQRGDSTSQERHRQHEKHGTQRPVHQGSNMVGGNKRYVPSQQVGSSHSQQKPVRPSQQPIDPA